MSFTPQDPRDIPVLTDAIDSDRSKAVEVDREAAQSAIVEETLRIADELLHQAAKDMEAILFERVFDRLREQLPDIVDKILKEQLDGVKARDP